MDPDDDHGTIPAIDPKTKGNQSTSSEPARFVLSINQPNRIMDTLAPATAINAPMSYSPSSMVISRIITVADSEYSTQRYGFWPRAIRRS